MEIALYRTFFFYIFITMGYKIMGKREIGELNVVDLMVSILIGQLVAVSIENYKESMFLTILPISLLILIEVTNSKISLKSRKFNELINGKPTTIIKNGKIIYKNMISQRYTLDDLLLSLRNEGISSIDEVSFAILEINGKLSIIKNNINPMPVIIEGKYQEEVLKDIPLSKSKINKIIKENNLSLEDIFYLIYKKNKLYIIKYK